MRFPVFLLSVVVFLGITACSENNRSKERLAVESRIYRCSSKATLEGSAGILQEDQQFIEVDFNGAPGVEGPTIKHNLQDKEIYVEFWSNVANGARATGYVKNFFGRTQWSAGTSSSNGLDDEFKIPLKAYDISKTEKVRFEVSCKKN